MNILNVYTLYVKLVRKNMNKKYLFLIGNKYMFLKMKLIGKKVFTHQKLPAMETIYLHFCGSVLAYFSLQIVFNFPQL